MKNPYIIVTPNGDKPLVMAAIPPVEQDPLWWKAHLGGLRIDHSGRNETWREYAEDIARITAHSA